MVAEWRMEEMKKARNYGQRAQKKGLTAAICYGRIFPH